MGISSQAYVYMIVFGITSIINTILTISIYGFYGPLFYFLALLISAPFVIFYMYHIDCLTSGSCNTWSWIYTTIACIGLIITTLMATFSVVFKDEVNNIIDNDKSNKEKPNNIPAAYNLLNA